MLKQQRNYRLSVQTIDGSTLIIKPPFTIEFDIKRNNLQSVNIGMIRIYNLSESNRRRVAKDEYAYNVYKRVQLDAGYGGQLATIFKGNISHAWSVREGVNFITTIEAFDGGDALINGVTNKSFAEGTPTNSVLQSVMQDLPNVTVGAIGAFPGTLPRGNTYSGPSGQIASQISQNGFFIDNEKAYALADNECVRGLLATVSADTGLLNTPVRSKQQLLLDILFEPRVLMCQILNVVSTTDPSLNGTYRVISISHRGMISDSVCGDAVTSLGLWQGTKGLVVVG